MYSRYPVATLRFSTGTQRVTVSQTEPEPRPGSAFSWKEDWLAIVVGLVLIGLVLVGAIPDRLVP